MPQCYMCDKEASTEEHVPPKCLFPEQKDTLFGKNYRKNLITVPSCEVHNTSRSKDDEYLLYVLTASITSNEIGSNQFFTKVQRAFKRNTKLVNLLPVGDTSAFNYVTKSGQLDEAFPIDAQGERIDNVISCCARALYYFETGRQFLGATKVIAPFMSYRDRSFNDAVSEALYYARELFKTTPKKGANPSVFYYKFTETVGTALLLLCFYKGTEFLVQLDSRNKADK